MRYRAKPGFFDAAVLLAERRREILAEYRAHRIDPIRIGNETISIELAVNLGLLIDLAAPPPDQLPELNEATA